MTIAILLMLISIASGPTIPPPSCTAVSYQIGRYGSAQKETVIQCLQPQTTRDAPHQASKRSNKSRTSSKRDLN